MNDPRLELVTLTGVDVSRDLSHATVFYSTLGATTISSGTISSGTGSSGTGSSGTGSSGTGSSGTTSAKEAFAQDAADALAAAAPHFRAVLGRQMRIRQVPRLDFEVDRGIVTGQRIDEILREIHHARGESDQAGGAGGGSEQS
jgi:ribosome-binding factor A